MCYINVYGNQAYNPIKENQLICFNFKDTIVTIADLGAQAITLEIEYT